MENYSDLVISLFKELRGKRKLIDILDLLEDATSCFLNEHDVPIQTLLTDFDTSIKNGSLENFTKLEIKKIYKVLNKFDKNYTIIEQSNKPSSVEKFIDMVKNQKDIESTEHIDNFIVKLRRKLRSKITRAAFPMNSVEEYSDEFNAHYIHLFYGKKEQKFAVIVIQNKLVMYHSYITNRKYPINLKKTQKGIDTLVNVFLDKDLEEIEKKNK